MRTLHKVASGHMPSLDGIRGIAILAVIAHNFTLDFTPGSILGLMVQRLADLGWVGVQLFFVLSGFLITGILLDSRDKPNYYRNFFARRVLRIFPIYYMTLFGAFVVMAFFGRPIEGHEHQLWLWTYLYNWVEPFGKVVPLLSHFWSLSVEEQFYFLWPAVVRRLRLKALVWVSMTLAGIALLSRVVLLADGFPPVGPYDFTVCRQDALVFGAVAAVMVRVESVAVWLDRRRAFLGWGIAGLLIGGVFITRGYPRTGLLNQTVGYSLLSIIFAGFILLAVCSEARGTTLARLLSLAPLQSIGKYSYAMYIFHLILRPAARAMVEDFYPQPSTAVNLAYLATMTLISYAIGLLSYHLIEKHFLALKKHFVQPHRAVAEVKMS